MGVNKRNNTRHPKGKNRIKIIIIIITTTFLIFAISQRVDKVRWSTEDFNAINFLPITFFFFFCYVFPTRFTHHSRFDTCSNSVIVSILLLDLPPQFPQICAQHLQRKHRTCPQQTHNRELQSFCARHGNGNGKPNWISQKSPEDLIWSVKLKSEPTVPFVPNCSDKYSVENADGKTRTQRGRF